MGCCSSDQGAYEPRMVEDHKLAQRLQAQEIAASRARRPAAAGPTLLGARQDWGASGAGKRLGGAGAAEAAPEVPEDLRRRALEAAERRQAAVPGMSKQRAAELRARQQKEELLGRISEYYSRRQLEVPMGLNAASAEQLKRHWDSLQRDGE